MSDVTLYLARTLCVRPHHDDATTFEIAWGEGSQRESFVTGSPVLASALATAPTKTLFDDEVGRLARLLNIDLPDARDLVTGLQNYGVYSTEPHDLAAAEERWLDVAWPDALDLHLATHDAMWVHDYTGNPKVMTRYFVDRRLDPETPPPSRCPVPDGETVELPAPKPLTEALDAVQARRRTSRHFRDTSIDLADVATVLDWSFAPQSPADDPTLYTAQTYSRGAPFVAFALFSGDGAPPEVRRDFATYQYDPVGKTLVHRDSAAIDEWSELLWQQTYADGAPMVLVVCADWLQYMWKYRTSRAYRWAYMECGAFMQTALTVGTGLGLQTFQTPAINDAAFCALLGVDDASTGPLYMAAFGRRTHLGERA
ncbi:nitroreductase family protein [Saccharopolyspora hattusasensis]|uniref:nitroreductase family protein n=1 Tax=Saccharopolyspora hattusasensis TaxID=1128679 RepID=UPI003D999FA4